MINSPGIRNTWSWVTALLLGNWKTLSKWLHLLAPSLSRVRVILAASSHGSCEMMQLNAQNLARHRVSTQNILNIISHWLESQLSRLGADLAISLLKPVSPLGVLYRVGILHPPQQLNFDISPTWGYSSALVPAVRTEDKVSPRM